MRNYSFELEFVTQQRNDLPFPPVARAFIAAYSGIEGNPHKFVTHDCMSAKEFDYEIDRLHAELETLRSEAQQRFVTENVR